MLTLKARKALDRADVVIHDRLVTPEILELARREALLIDAGKTGFGRSMAQSDINALIVEHGAKGAHVVRLKSGDPTVFGRLDEEIEAISVFIRDGLYDPQLLRHVPDYVMSGFCFPNADQRSKEDLGCY